MVDIEITVINRSGLHTRPAAALVKLASRFKSEIQLSRDGFMINAKSIIGVMTLAAEMGSTLRLIVEGNDEVQAAEEIKALFDSGFGEVW